jgi:hypothetical protein
MGLFRALAPRSVKKARRAMNPVGVAKSAATPRVVKKARKVANPVNAAQANVERSVNRSIYGQPKARKEATPRAPSQGAWATVRGLDPVAQAILGLIALGVVVALVVASATSSDAPKTTTPATSVPKGPQLELEKTNAAFCASYRRAEADGYSGQAIYQAVLDTPGVAEGLGARGFYKHLIQNC